MQIIASRNIPRSDFLSITSGACCLWLACSSSVTTRSGASKLVCLLSLHLSCYGYLGAGDSSGLTKRVLSTGSAKHVAHAHLTLSCLLELILRALPKCVWKHPLQRSGLPVRRALSKSTHVSFGSSAVGLSLLRAGAIGGATTASFVRCAWQEWPRV